MNWELRTADVELTVALQRYIPPFLSSRGLRVIDTLIVPSIGLVKMFVAPEKSLSNITAVFTPVKLSCMVHVRFRVVPS